MSDVRLVVGVDTGASEQQIIRDIDSIISSINNSPRKIKIEFDFDKNIVKNLGLQGITQSAKDATSEINSIASSLKTVNSEANKTSSSVDKTSASYVQVARAVESLQSKIIGASKWTDALYSSKEAKDAYNSIQNLKEGLASLETQYNSGEINIKQYGLGVQQLNLEYQKYSNVVKEAGVIAEQNTAKMKAAVDAQAAKTKELAEEEKARAQALKDELQIQQSVASLQSKIIGASKWTAALSGTGETREAYTSIQNINGALADLETRFRSGEISSADYKNAIRQLNIEYREQANVIKDAGANHKSFLDSMGSITQIVARYVSVYKIFQMAVRTIKQMVNEVIRLDDAMTQLRVVTDNTEAEYSRFSKTVAATAREIGASITDLVDSTTTYARLGYSLEESTALARYTGMLTNVGAIDVSSAQSAITAITKAYDIGADQIESVMDKLVEVGKEHCPAA